jgi:hypothetical protein
MQHDYDPDCRCEHGEHFNDIDRSIERVLADAVMSFHEACEEISALAAP